MASIKPAATSAEATGDRFQGAHQKEATADGKRRGDAMRCDGGGGSGGSGGSGDVSTKQDGDNKEKDLGAT